MILSDLDIWASVQNPMGMSSVEKERLYPGAQGWEPQISIEPFDVRNVQPSSVDLTLAREYREPRPGLTGLLDLANLTEGHTVAREMTPSGVVMYPGNALLFCTEEVVKLGSSVAARVEGKSSLGRVFLAVHITAGFIDPGFEGHITLEVVNLSPWPLKLHAGMPIAQISFFPTSGVVESDYTVKGHYARSTAPGPVESRYRIPKRP